MQSADVALQLLSLVIAEGYFLTQRGRIKRLFYLLRVLLGFLDLFSHLEIRLEKCVQFGLLRHRLERVLLGKDVEGLHQASHVVR